MTTASLNRRRSAGRRNASVSTVESRGGSPVPSFQLAFPAPAGYGPKHDLYAMRVAANRVYQARRNAYRALAPDLDAVQMLEHVRRDVLSRLLEEDPATFGPFKYTVYRWLDPQAFRAWLPTHRNHAERLYAEFRRKMMGRLAEQDLGRY